MAVGFNLRQKAIFGIIIFQTVFVAVYSVPVVSSGVESANIIADVTKVPELAESSGTDGANDSVTKPKEGDEVQIGKEVETDQLPSSEKEKLAPPEEKTPIADDLKKEGEINTDDKSVKSTPSTESLPIEDLPKKEIAGEFDKLKNPKSEDAPVSGPAAAAESSERAGSGTKSPDTSPSTAPAELPKEVPYSAYSPTESVPAVFPSFGFPMYPRFPRFPRFSRFPRFPRFPVIPMPVIPIKADPLHQKSVERTKDGPYHVTKAVYESDPSNPTFRGRAEIITSKMSDDEPDVALPQTLYPDHIYNFSRIPPAVTDTLTRVMDYMRHRYNSMVQSF